MPLHKKHTSTNTKTPTILPSDNHNLIPVSRQDANNFLTPPTLDQLSQIAKIKVINDADFGNKIDNLLTTSSQDIKAIGDNSSLEEGFPIDMIH